MYASFFFCNANNVLYLLSVVQHSNKIKLTKNIKLLEDLISDETKTSEGWIVILENDEVA